MTVYKPSNVSACLNCPFFKWKDNRDLKVDSIFLFLDRFNAIVTSGRVMQAVAGQTNSSVELTWPNASRIEESVLRKL